MTMMRLPLAQEAAECLHRYTRVGYGPSERLAYLGALHGYLVAGDAMPHGLRLLEDARSFDRPRLPDDIPPCDLAEHFTASHVHLIRAINWEDLVLEPVYLAGVLYGYRQGTSEWDDATICGDCGRRMCPATEVYVAECPYTGEFYCDSTEHREHCPNPSDCFSEDDDRDR